MRGKLDAMADRFARDAEAVETRMGAAIEKKFACLREDLQGRLNALAADVEKTQQSAQMSPRLSASMSIMSSPKILLKLPRLIS